MAETVPVVTDATFDEEVLKSDLPVLVEFWAPWCVPCRQVAPVVEEIAAGHVATMRTVKINSDDNPLTVAKYGVISLPTLAVYVGGEPVKMIIGAKPKLALLRELSEWLG
jgi:thioredoxin 1